MNIQYDDIIKHALDTEFIVTKPIYWDEKEKLESEHESGGDPSKGWPFVREGFRFKPEKITFHINEFDQIDFYVVVEVPRDWIHLGWMESPTAIFQPEPAEVYVSALDLVERCDEAQATH